MALPLPSVAPLAVGPLRHEPEFGERLQHLRQVSVKQDVENSTAFLRQQDEATQRSLLSLTEPSVLQLLRN